MLNTNRKVAGFSMIEVLITLIIILIGVLGMAGVQMLAINNTQISRSHSLAAISGSSLSAMMQVNEPYWVGTTLNSTVSATMGQAWTSATIAGDSTLNGNSQNCATSTCSASQLATYDLKNWALNLATVLPQGKATVKCGGSSGTTPNICTITISWIEKTVVLHNDQGTASGAMASATANTQTYTTTASIN